MLSCEVCGILMPATRSMVGKAAGAAIGGLLGASTRTWWGTLLMLGAGLAAGHLVDEAMRPVCGHCEVRRT